MKLNRIIFHLKIDDVHFIVTRKCICCESYAMAYFQIFRHKKSEMRKIERERESARERKTEKIGQLSFLLQSQAI